jgi:hypothetical protein
MHCKHRKQYRTVTACGQMLGFNPVVDVVV